MGKKPKKIGLIIPIVVICFNIGVIAFLNDDGSTEQVSVAADEISYNGDTYKTGFYDDLRTKNVFVMSEITADNGEEYYTVAEDKYNFLFDGTDSEYDQYSYALKFGELYIDSKQFDEAKTYYSDINNFSFYCDYGWNNEANPFERIEIQNMDPEKFMELKEFAKLNKFNEVGEYFAIPFNRDELKPFVFFKESNDGYFESRIYDSFFIIDNKLVLMLYIDYNGANDDSESPEIVYVDVPTELSDYFINLLRENNFDI